MPGKSNRRRREALMVDRLPTSPIARSEDAELSLKALQALGRIEAKVDAPAKEAGEQSPLPSPIPSTPSSAASRLMKSASQVPCTARWTLRGSS